MPSYDRAIVKVTRDAQISPLLCDERADTLLPSVNPPTWVSWSMRDTNSKTPTPYQKLINQNCFNTYER